MLFKYLPKWWPALLCCFICIFAMQTAHLNTHTHTLIYTYFDSYQINGDAHWENLCTCIWINHLVIYTAAFKQYAAAAAIFIISGYSREPYDKKQLQWILLLFLLLLLLFFTLCYEQIMLANQRTKKREELPTRTSDSFKWCFTTSATVLAFVENKFVWANEQTQLELVREPFTHFVRRPFGCVAWERTQRS